jgi:hypothetical protein
VKEKPKKTKHRVYKPERIARSFCFLRRIFAGAMSFGSRESAAEGG